MVELIATEKDSDLYGADIIEELHDKHNLLVQVNTIKLNDHKDLYAGLDENLALLDNPEKSWGKLVEFGVDIIQTDWPFFLNEFREKIK